MSDEIRNDEVNETKVEEKAAESRVEGVANSLKGAFSSFLSKATEIGNSVAKVASEKFEEGKEFVDEKRREHEANEIYRKLGKKVTKLVKRGELTLPESCQQYVDAIDDLYGDDDDEKCCCDDDKCCCDDDKCCCDDACCCDDEKCCCDDDKCCCDDKKDDASK